MDYDVIVVGGGNAGLCAAMSAVENGAKVLLLERSPIFYRGGNSRHTRDIRYAHDKPNSYTSGSYTAENFYKDILEVTKGETNKELAKFCVEKSQDIIFWMQNHGCKFQPTIKGALHLANSVAFFSGGGKSMVNNYYHYCQRVGVKIIYDAFVVDLKFENKKFYSVVVNYKHSFHEITAKSLVLACGGFQSNIEQLKEIWGNPANNLIIRGTPYNEGNIFKILIENNAMPVGDPKNAHMLALDARAPKFDGGIVTRLDCIPFGIVVNKNATRFYDEGEDIWPKRYAIWGHILINQPDQIGYVIFDSKVVNLFMPSAFPAFRADSLKDLCAKLNLNSESLIKTVEDYNNHLSSGKFDPSILDDCKTIDLEPPKSHWALPIDKPPFYAYPLRPGITFTYLSVKVNKNSQILTKDGEPFENVFAAGEIMSGNILSKGYMAGTGLTIGTVFGITAGKEAASV
jgi:tricarballylate dehydrogenase